MNYNKIAKVVYPFSYTFLDYPNNESGAILIYFLGCNHNCKNCQNADFQNYDYVSDYTKEFNMKEFYKEIESACKKNNTNKIIFSGGDPLSPYHLDFVRTFLKKYCSIFDIIVYTGYGIDYIKKHKVEGFKFIKTEKYKENESQESIKTDSYIQFASRNQVLYNNLYMPVSRNGRHYFR